MKRLFDDLPDFIKFLGKKDELIIINKSVSSKYEAATIQMKILNEIGKAVLFTNIDGNEKGMLGNVYASRSKISYMFGVTPQKLVEKFMSFKSSTHQFR